MARNAKDLRDLICVSRLSVRDYESDSDFSDGGEAEETSSDEGRPASFTAASRSGVMGEGKYSTCSSSKCRSDIVVGRPGSAVGTVPRPQDTRYKLRQNRVTSLPGYFKLPQPDISDSISPKMNADRPELNSNFSTILDYVDGTVINEMLTRCSCKMNAISDWISCPENFVNFCQFYFSYLEIEQRDGLIMLEYSIVKDELAMVFKAGLESGKVLESDLNDILNLTLPEYARRFLDGKDGAYLLKVICKLCNVQADDAKALLSNVHFSTRNKNHIQWILGIRAFGLISIVDGVLQFYWKAKKLGLDAKIDKREAFTESTSGSLLSRWALLCVKGGFLDVCKFLVKHLKLNLCDVQDQHGRNVIMISVIYNQAKMLPFLIAKTKDFLDVNKATETGNTALHLAVSKGNKEAVRELLLAGADPNARNLFSNGSTPLHSAVLNGDLEIVILLAEHGATIELADKETECVSSLSLAKDFGETEIASYLESRLEK